jgi:predicted transcriptional regulator
MTRNLTFYGGKTRDRIVKYLSQNPGATSDAIAKALDITPAAASSALNSMYNAGIVTRPPKRVGHHFPYILKEQKEPRPVQLLMPMNPEVDQLKARLAELEAFKAEAVAKHPDLVPIDYEAYREALTTYYDVGGWPHSAEDMRSGQPITAAERKRIKALIAAAKLFPKGQDHA